MTLNPEMDEKTVLELIAEIDDEQPIEEVSFGEKQNGDEDKTKNPIEPKQ